MLKTSLFWLRNEQKTGKGYDVTFLTNFRLFQLPYVANMLHLWNPETKVYKVRYVL